MQTPPPNKDSESDPTESSQNQTQSLKKVDTIEEIKQYEQIEQALADKIYSSYNHPITETGDDGDNFDNL